ncbi:MAG: recombinase family protein [Ktedonobacteraceae bacterium]
MALIGYARVSKTEQNLDLQLDALKKAGCVRVFTDKLTGTKFEQRKQFQAALEYLNTGDTLVVWKIDRLGRSLKQLILTLEQLAAKDIQLVITTQNIDTTTPIGKMFFYLVALFAEFEHDLISERTKAGLEAARARGHKGGRRPINLATGKPALALKLYDDKANKIDDICKNLGIARRTLFRWVEHRKQEQAQQQKVS